MTPTLADAKAEARRLWGSARALSVRVGARALLAGHALLARLRAASLEPGTSPPRVRASVFWLSAFALTAAAGALALALGGSALLGADPLRLFSRPLAALTLDRAEMVAAARNRIALAEDYRAALQGLASRARVLQLEAPARDRLDTAITALAQRIAGDRAALREGSLPDAKTSGDLDVGVEALTRRAAQRFAADVEAGVETRLNTDAQTLATLAEQGDAEGLPRLLSAARQSLPALRQLAADTARARTAEAALAGAGRTADLATAALKLTAPIANRKAAQEARAEFRLAASAASRVLADLAAQAQDRPWIFADQARKDAWRAAQARWEAYAPLANELGELVAAVSAADDPETIRAATFRAREIEAQVLAGGALPSAAPPLSAPESPVRAAEAAIAERLATDAAAADRLYRQEYEASAAYLDAPLRRRRDRRLASRLNDALKDLYGAAVRLDRIAEAAASGAGPAAVAEAETLSAEARRAAERARGLRADLEDNLERNQR